MGLAHSIICYSTSKQASKENEIVVGRSDHTTSFDGLKKRAIQLLLETSV